MKTWKKSLAILFIVGMIISALPTNVQAAGKSKIKLSKKKLTLYVGNTKTLKLKGTKKTPKWSSSRKSVATVTKKGKIKAKKKGSTVITARLGKKKYKCKVTVKKDSRRNSASQKQDLSVPSKDNTNNATVTPSVADNYQKLANYLMRNGIYNSGDYYIGDLTGDNLDWFATISYMPSASIATSSSRLTQRPSEESIPGLVAPEGATVIPSSLSNAAAHSAPDWLVTIISDHPYIFFRSTFTGSNENERLPILNVSCFAIFYAVVVFTPQK